VEVYSKSAGQWSAGVVDMCDTQMVKVRYWVSGQWCEKVLLQGSDSLRLRQDAKALPESADGTTAPRQSIEVCETSEARALRHAKGSAKGVAELLLKAVPTSAPVVRQVSNPALGQAGRQTPPMGGYGNISAPTLQADPTAASSRQRSCTPPPGQPRGQQRTAVETMKEQGVILNIDELSFDKVLGQGGFGSVYRGRYRGAEVAIKKMHPPQEGNVKPEQIAEFQKEVENLHALNHPRLVAFIGVAVQAPALCIVTEFMNNGSLYALLHEKKQFIPSYQRNTISVHVAEGIVFLHTMNPPMVHRDVKSLNVVLDLQLNAKLCDFGLTQSMEKTHISRRDNEFGSPRYMAPELFHSKGKVTEKVDVWALGCVVLEVCTSQIPHQDEDNVQAVMKKCLLERQWPYTDFRGDAAKLRVVAELCFEYHPTYRVAAARILDELHRLRGAVNGN